MGEDMYPVLQGFVKESQKPPEVCVVCLLYVERWMRVSGLRLLPDNWDSVTLIALILSSKVWDDESFENFDFAVLLSPRYTLSQLAEMERTFLQLVQYRLGVSGRDYAEAYFVLRALAAEAGAELPIGRLDK